MSLSLERFHLELAIGSRPHTPRSWGEWASQAPTSAETLADLLCLPECAVSRILVLGGVAQVIAVSAGEIRASWRQKKLPHATAAWIPLPDTTTGKPPSDASPRKLAELKRNQTLQVLPHPGKCVAQVYRRTSQIRGVDEARKEESNLTARSTAPMPINVIDRPWTEDAFSRPEARVDHATVFDDRLR